MKKSVFVITYNRPEYLNKVLDAFGRQSRPPGELACFKAIEVIEALAAPHEQSGGASPLDRPSGEP